MAVTIALIVSLCGGVSLDQVNQKRSALEQANPGAKVSVRIKKETCSK